MSPFDYVKSILQDKTELITDSETEEKYSPFLTNRSLSYHMDCLAFANEMNRRHHLDKKMQFDFLLNTVRSKKRPFTKWAKSEKSEDISCLKQTFGFSDKKAYDALNLLSEEEIQQLKEKTDTGGLRK